MITREEHDKEITGLTTRLHLDIENLKERASENRKDISTLREYKSEELGKAEKENGIAQRQTWIIMAAIGVASILIAGCGILSSIGVTIGLKLLGY
jgi:hypothetical protein